MKTSFLSIAVFAIVFTMSGNQHASAEVIHGPTVNITGNIGGSTNTPGLGSSWGLQFTANQDTYLLAFLFSHYSSAAAGTIDLVDVTDPLNTITVESWVVTSTPLKAGFHGVDLLHQGNTYQLTYTQLAGDYSDEKFAYLGTGVNAPYKTGTTDNYSNADITVTHGVENGVLSGTTGFAVWYAFNNISTSQTVPEPSSLALLAAAGCCVLIHRARRGR